MASTYTTVLKLAKPGLGDTGWGSTVNTGLTDMLEQALTGAVSVPVVVGLTTTLPAISDGTSSDARNQFLNITGSLTVGQTATVRVPAGVAANNKLYFVKNSAGGDVTVETSGGSSVIVPAGKSMALRVTSAGVEQALNHLVTLSLSTALPVSSGGTGATSLTSNAVLIGNGTGAVTGVAPGTLNNVLTSDGTNWISAAPTPTTTFSGGTTGLTPNTPTSGAVTLGGTLNVANGGTGATTLTGVLKGNGTGAFTAGNVSLTSEVTGTLPVGNGGTGATTLAANAVLIGNGTGAITTVAPGANNNVLTSNGTSWVSSAPAPGTTFSAGTTGFTPNTPTSGAVTLGGTLAVANGGTGVTSSTGTGSVVLSTSPVLVTPALGTPSSGTLTNCTGLPLTGTTGTLAVNRGGTGVTSSTGTGNVVLSTSPVFTTKIEVDTITIYRGGNSDVNSTAVGRDALLNNSSGNYNSAFGRDALKANTTGQENTAVGTFALSTNSTGISNSAFGSRALSANTSGTANTAVGTAALTANTNGFYNVAVGSGSIGTNSSGSGNTGIGSNALSLTTTGNYNCAVGYLTLSDNTTGSNNTAVGYNALADNTSGVENDAFGQSSLRTNTTGNYNCAIGGGSLNVATTASNNASVGYASLVANTTGANNTALGFCAGVGTITPTPPYIPADANTTGSNNTFIGFESIGASATASNVITLGNNAIATLRCQVTTITALSDRRDKTNIVDIPAGLNFIQALRPVAFDWNMRDGKKVGIHEFGFIAQELQDAQVATGITVPNLVSTENPDKLEASPGTLLPVLVRAIQELKAELDSVKAELAALKGN